MVVIIKNKISINSNVNPKSSSLKNEIYIATISNTIDIIQKNANIFSSCLVLTLEIGKKLF